MGSITPAPASACSQCGAATASENLLTLWGQTVCAACKPDFVRRMQEGTLTPAIGVYKGFWLRVLARLLDGLLIWIVAIPFGLGATRQALRMTAAHQPGAAAVMVRADLRLYGALILFWFAYYTFFHGRFGATLGKMAIHAKVVNADGTSIGYSKALGRCVADILSGIILDIGYIMAAFDPQKRTLHDRICGTRVIAK